MKLWVDDVRPAPGRKEEGWIHLFSVNEVKEVVELVEAMYGLLDYEANIEFIDLDHDAGVFANDGGDYIRILDWLEETGRNYPIRIHSQNPVGIQNMRRIIERNGWKEIK